MECIHNIVNQSKNFKPNIESIDSQHNFRWQFPKSLELIWKTFVEKRNKSFDKRFIVGKDGKTFHKDVSYYIIIIGWIKYKGNFNSMEVFLQNSFYALQLS